jgi:phthiocerol/phenolphthiocerol synthesis type-I polyketide synthase D
MGQALDGLNSKDLQFSLMFFACTEDALRGSNYRLVIESARFADKHGFTSVWVPERHFTGFGYLYPNPAVLHAALARETESIQLRAGSVVAPLHNPLRIAEEWTMVDNLSGGRVGISFASGWNPNDFAFFPERYQSRNEQLYEAVATVQKLWRGESIETLSGSGQKVQVRIYPSPLQPELPTWITAAGNPRTFIRAGQLGANVLTHLLDHSVEEIAARIALYRQARRANGHDPESGQVTIMLHTFLGTKAEEVRELVRGPYSNWLKSNAGLLKGLATNRGIQINLDAFSSQDRHEFANLLFERTFSSRSLMGTPETCLELITRLQGVGVTEIACLLDFGPAEDLILEHLPHLHRMKELYHAQGVIPLPPKLESNQVALFRSIKETDEAPARRPMGNSLSEIQARCQEVSVTEFYEMLCRFGAQLESRFRGVRRLWRGEGEALAQVLLSEELGMEAHGYKIHPAFLDSCLQIFAATLPAGLAQEEDIHYLPVGLRSFDFWGHPSSELWSHAVLTSNETTDHFEGDISIVDKSGQLVGMVAGFKLQRTANGGTAGTGDLSDWFYEIRWTEKEIEKAEPARESFRWLVFADQSGVGRQLAATLTKAGDTCLLVYRGDCRQAEETAEYWIDPARKEQMRWLIEKTLGQGSGPFRGVVHLWSLDSRPTQEITAEGLEEDQLLGSGSALHLVQALVAAKVPVHSCRLWFITRGTQSIEQAPRPISLAQSPLWGFAKSCAVEHSEIWGGLVDLDPHDSLEEAADQLVSLLRSVSAEDQIAFRAGRLFAPRLARRREALQSAPSFRADASYLVTGGLGGIGLKLAHWLVNHGARHLVLLGRRMPPPRSAWNGVTPGSRAAQQIAAIQKLEAQGARVMFASVDVADEAQITAFLRTLEPDSPPLRGVLHAAGIGRGGTLVDMDLNNLREVLRPKVTGSWLLHHLLQNCALDFFVLFSSATHQLGVLGQGAAAYSAASSFLDALGHYRRAISQPALSIDWGPWSEVGMAAETRNVVRLQGFGIGAVPPRLGAQALGHFLGRDLPQVWVIPVNWGQLLRIDSSLSRSPFVSELVREVAGQGESEGELAKRAEFREGLRNLPTKGRARRLETYIQDQIVVVMGLESREEVDWRRGLFEIGMDSLMALELRNRLQSGLGFPISSTLAFDHPTVESISQFLAQEIFPGEIPVHVMQTHRSEFEERIAAAAEEVRGLDDKEMERLLERKLESF